MEKVVSGNHGRFPTHTAFIIPVISINRKSKNCWFMRLWVGVRNLHLNCLASFHVRVLGFPELMCLNMIGNNVTIKCVVKMRKQKRNLLLLKKTKKQGARCRNNTND